MDKPGVSLLGHGLKRVSVSGLPWVCTVKNVFAVGRTPGGAESR